MSNVYIPFHPPLQSPRSIYKVPQSNYLTLVQLTIPQRCTEAIGETLPGSVHQYNLEASTRNMTG